MFNLPKITVREFYELDEIQVLGYLDLQEHLNARNMFFGNECKPLGQFTFGEVAEFKSVFLNSTYEGLLDLFKTTYGVKESQYLQSDVVDYFYALKYLRGEILSLHEREKLALTSEPDPELELAGVKRLNKFGELPTLIDLAERFGKTLEEIENWKYNTVFAILLFYKTKSEIKKNYDEIKKVNNGN